ncbi:lipid-binding SYLF domain-containing protein [Desulforhopalus singaporensis]|uniref:Las17-binding protein actin regulator n=1 Tax=Desulforhopalus singaporensis TaxID=91360 RepID=A0A1H0L695_9BACT|nr:YSC84-related protein [Desulforhopalus singaporensis]SDO63759.1 Las17-binding protein actin regulator [Desulforhopalus singaporensis]
MKTSLVATMKKAAAAAAVLLAMFFFVADSFGASAQQIDIEVDVTLQEFAKEVRGGGTFLAKAEGVLVFPKVIKAGFVVGGEYGEGALRIGGKTVHYYNTAGASFGFQLGAQVKTLVIVFLDQGALQRFINSEGWEAGVDGSVAIAQWGVGEDLSSTEFADPIIAFVFNNKGLMYNLTIEGAKFTRIVR